MKWTLSRISKLIVTLQDFQVNCKHVPIPALATEAEKKVINRICVETARFWMWQCGREHDFGTSEVPLHQTTQLYKMELEELKSMPTNSMIMSVC